MVKSHKDQRSYNIKHSNSLQDDLKPSKRPVYQDKGDKYLKAELKQYIG